MAKSDNQKLKLLYIKKMLEDKESYLLVVDVNPYEPTGNALNEDKLAKGKEA